MRFLSLIAVILLTNTLQGQDLKQTIVILRIKEENTYAKAYKAVKEGQHFVLWIGDVDFEKYNQVKAKYPKAEHCFEKTFPLFKDCDAVVGGRFYGKVIFVEQFKKDEKVAINKVAEIPITQPIQTGSTCYTDPITGKTTCPQSSSTRRKGLGIFR